MKACVITFPGSNCDRDIGTVLQKFYNFQVHYLWHKDIASEKYDLFVLPGGFSYGDYLRSGAMARFSRAMDVSVMEHVRRGGLLLGICNGFQILTEAELLPGALTRNKNLQFICKDVKLVGEKNNSISGSLDKKLTIPIAHAEGCYFADVATLKLLNDENRVLFRYADENPNGSLENIAGITSKDNKIIGLMPHPERAMNDATGNMDGKEFFDRILAL